MEDKLTALLYQFSYHEMELAYAKHQLGELGFDVDSPLNADLMHDIKIQVAQQELQDIELEIDLNDKRSSLN